MDKKELLFYDAYESFYDMAKQSKAFKDYCQDAFGEDFSQDGFSDVSQVNMILPYIADGEQTRILDIGCGNGKMLRYLQSKKNCSICGFDYSENAIRTAKEYVGVNADFREGIIGEIEYPAEYFDVIISMDTMYFASDMPAFVKQLMSWLKRGGTVFVAYQEGDVMPKTENEHTTVFAKALQENHIDYEVNDITEQTYEMLKRKRLSAMKYKEEFAAEGNNEWFDMLMWQTECADCDYEKFASQMSRYIYVVKK